MIGLDPLAIDQVLKSLVSLKNEGKAVFMSTHIIDMIDDIWDVAYIMDDAKIVKVVNRDELQENQSLKQLFFEYTGANHE
jgi:ABC-type multidrug transport system ATPase subunit